MTAPIPATDAQLLQAAQHGVDVWIDQTQRAFDQQWRTSAELDQLLSAVPAGPRRSLWASLLNPIINDCSTDLNQLLMQRRDELRAEALGQLQAASPRLSVFDLQGATGDKMLVGIVTATPAGRDVATAVAAAGARIQEYANRAAPLEQLSAGKQAALANAYSALQMRAANIEQLRGVVQEYADATTLLGDVGPRIWAACDAALHLSMDPSKPAADADHALIGARDGTLADQQAAVTGPFQGATAAVAGADATLTSEVDELAATVIRYLWGSTRATTYGPVFRATELARGLAEAESSTGSSS